MWAQVDVDDSRLEGKAEKINITMPRRFLTRVDEYAKRRGMSCSGFLVEAAPKRDAGLSGCDTSSKTSSSRPLIQSLIAEVSHIAPAHQRKALG